MMIRDIKKFEKNFDKFAPKKAAKFEYSGVIKNTIPKSGSIKKMSLCLDLTSKSIKKAIKNKSDLLIAFHAPDELKESQDWQKNIKNLSRGKLTLYKAHLRLNFCKNGVNDILCKICRFDARPMKFILEGRYEILGGVFLVSGKYDLKQISDNLKAIKSPQIRIYNKKNNNYKYKKILISSGSGFKKEFFQQLKPDCVISGEVKHNIIYLAKEYGVTLFEITHWASEDRPLSRISKLLEQYFGLPVDFISLPLDLVVKTK